MTQADVVYADVNFTKSNGKVRGETSSPAETIYSDVKTKQPSDSQKQALLDEGSKVTSERVALFLLGALLTAAVVALIYVSWDFVQTKQRLENRDDTIKNLTESYYGLKETLDKVSCPAGENTTEPCRPCPENWEERGDQCYFFNTQPSSWDRARVRCLQQGGDLVRIDSQEEQKFLTTALRPKMKEDEDKFWIGLTDSETEGQWLWVDGTPLIESLTFWNDDEPNNFTGENPEHGEDCARMGDTSSRVTIAKWFDRNCNHSHKSVCEKSAVRGHLFCV